MRRTLAFTALLVLAGCGTRPAAAPQGDPIACAVGDDAFATDCTVEREPSDRGLLLTLHRPDGGFRRLLVTTDGRGVAAADGAEPARVTVVGPAQIEVRIADERYRLPATLKPGSR